MGYTIVFTGKGVFAAERICCGSYVAHYSGAFIQEEEIQDDTYVFELRRGSKKLLWV